MPDCVFCAIVRGDAPARRVYEDEHVVAFLDVRPFSAGHTLIVPKRHAAGLADLAPDDAARVFRVAQQVGLALRRTGADGVHLVLNDGRAAAQTVFHAHVHAIPRRRGDKLQMARRMVVRRPGGGDLDRAAAQLRAALT